MVHIAWACIYVYSSIIYIHMCLGHHYHEESKPPATGGQYETASPPAAMTITTSSIRRVCCAEDEVYKIVYIMIAEEGLAMRQGYSEKSQEAARGSRA